METLCAELSTIHEPALGGGLDPLRFARDPLVAVNSGAADLLLGVTELALWGEGIRTKTVSLERGQPLTHRAQPPAPP